MPTYTVSLTNGALKMKKDYTTNRKGGVTWKRNS